MSSRIVMQTFVIWFSKNNKSPATARFDPFINFFKSAGSNKKILNYPPYPHIISVDSPFKKFFFPK